MFLSGALLFWSESRPLISQLLLPRQVSVPVPARHQRPAFHTTVYKSVDKWNKDAVTPSGRGCGLDRIHFLGCGDFLRTLTAYNLK